MVPADETVSVRDDLHHYFRPDLQGQRFRLRPPPLEVEVAARPRPAGGAAAITSSSSSSSTMTGPRRCAVGALGPFKRSFMRLITMPKGSRACAESSLTKTKAGMSTPGLLHEPTIPLDVDTSMNSKRAGTSTMRSTKSSPSTAGVFVALTLRRSLTLGPQWP
jgi:hypothetical protein